MIAEQYCRHALFDCYQISVSDGKQSWAGHPRDFNWQSLDGAILVSHNAYFDRTAYAELVRRGLVPQLKFAGWECSANLTAYICNRRALAQAVEYLYKVKLSKSTRDDSDNRRFPADYNPAQQEEMRAYGRSDALWCWRLWNDHSHKWPVSEQRLSNMTIDEGMRGVQINAELLDTYIIQSHQMKMATERLLPWLQDDDDDDSWQGFATKPTSTKCIAEQCRRAGIPAPPVKAHYEDGEARYEEWEITYKKNNPWISALSSWRTVNRLYKTFLTAKSRLRPDNTMPFALKYVGSHTKRWSGDANINFQNLKKRPVYATQEGIMETDDARPPGDWVKYELDFRKLIVPRKGTVMIVGDLSQIEARVAAYLAGDTELLDLVRSGVSLYESHARTSMGWTGGDLKKENPQIYSLAKARILALSFGCGWEKFIVMAQNLAGIDITAEDPEFVTDADGKQVSGYGQHSKEIVNDFRKKNPKILETWAMLELGFKRSVGSDFRVVLNSGNALNYESVKVSRLLKPDRQTGKPKLATVFTAEVGGRRMEFYSGKLFENAVQSFARDVFAEGLIRIEDAGHQILFHSHDEVIVECQPGTDPKEIERLMSICPDWCKGLPVAAEGKQVPHYCKLE